MTGLKQRNTTRQEILTAAHEAFVEKGYAAASMDDIRTRADVSKGTLYYHFTSKEALFLACVKTTTRDMYADWLALSHEAKHATDKLYLLGDYYKTHAHRSLSNVIPEYLAAASAKESVFTLIRPEYRMFESVLREGIQRGEFRQSLPIESIILALHASFTALGSTQKNRETCMHREIITSMVHGIK
ncbi:TetR/AcrR family transcriptional regulator [Bacillus daqingensis]|uniref:TetR/AcrR family transcriptional regulator n=1 Tax=Bacillus daqingensis TaxID=872396 RepID=A0ABV9NXW6_9BACI